MAAKIQGVMRAAQMAGGMGAFGGKVDDSPTIKVCVRVRPFIKEEIEGSRSGGQTSLCIAMPTKTHVEMFSDEHEDRKFEFDRCYWSHTPDHPHYATQQTLQEELGDTMITQALSGFNNCIFAYGQTGSGKSYSVLGGKGDERGLLPRVIEGFFDQLGQFPPTATIKTVVAILEIYNEQLRDLLATTDEMDEDLSRPGRRKKGLDIKQHPVLGTIVPGLTEVPVNSCKEVLDLVDYGTSMRMVSATAMNATSSRSHCIFTFKTSVVEESGQAKVSQTHLVDLAGSERSKRTGAQGDRLREGAAINQSLSILARVISELAKKSKKTKPPFRDSKLTYMLKESLCGNSKTIMMAAISPNQLDYEETVSTMKFAESVKKVQTSAIVNSVNEKGIEAQLRAELQTLKAELETYQSQMAIDPGQTQVLQKRLQEQEQLCAMWGQDWDSYRQREQQRALRRTSLTLEERENLQEKFGLLEDDVFTEVASSRVEPGDYSASDVGLVLFRIEGVDDDLMEMGPRDSLCAPTTREEVDEIVVMGKTAEQVQDDSDRSAALSKQADDFSDGLKDLVAQIDQAQEAVCELADFETSSLTLRAQAVIDLKDPSRVSAAVLASVKQQNGEEKSQLLTGSQFDQVNSWIQAERRLHCIDSNGPMVDAWSKACSATGLALGSGAAEEASWKLQLQEMRKKLSAVEVENAELRARVEASMKQASTFVDRLKNRKTADRIREGHSKSQLLADLIRQQFQRAVEGLEHVVDRFDDNRSGAAKACQNPDVVVTAPLARSGLHGAEAEASPTATPAGVDVRKIASEDPFADDDDDNRNGAAKACQNPNVFVTAPLASSGLRGAEAEASPAAFHGAEAEASPAATPAGVKVRKIASEDPFADDDDNLSEVSTQVSRGSPPRLPAGRRSVRPDGEAQALKRIASVDEDPFADSDDETTSQVSFVSQASRAASQASSAASPLPDAQRRPGLVPGGQAAHAPAAQKKSAAAAQPPIHESDEESGEEF